MLHLNFADRNKLSGARGYGVRFAMRMIVAVAEQYGAKRLIDIYKNMGCDPDMNISSAVFVAKELYGIAVPVVIDREALEEA